jgi:hypothetical protein
LLPKQVLYQTELHPENLISMPQKLPLTQLLRND